MDNSVPSDRYSKERFQRESLKAQLTLQSWDVKKETHYLTETITHRLIQSDGRFQNSFSKELNKHERRRRPCKTKTEETGHIALSALGVARVSTDSRLMTRINKLCGNEEKPHTRNTPWLSSPDRLLMKKPREPGDATALV